MCSEVLTAGRVHPNQTVRGLLVTAAQFGLLQLHMDACENHVSACMCTLMSQ